MSHGHSVVVEVLPTGVSHTHAALGERRVARPPAPFVFYLVAATVLYGDGADCMGLKTHGRPVK